MKNLWKKIEDFFKGLSVLLYLYKKIKTDLNELKQTNNEIISLLKKGENKAEIISLRHKIEEVKRYISVLHGTNGQNIVYKDTVVKELLEASLYFLKTATEFCHKHEIKYWLDFGGLLGFVRNGGIIPWDDDIDISMLKEDFNKFFDLFSKEVKDINSPLYNKFEIYYEDWEGDYSSAGRQLRITDDKDKSIYFDIFLYDSLPILSDNELLQTGEEIRQIVNKIKLKECYNIDTLHKKLTYYKQNNVEKGFLFLSPITPVYQPLIHKYEDIFPLKKVVFEGIPVYIPNKERVVLVTLYNDYWDVVIKPSHGKNKKIINYLEGRNKNG